MDNKKFNIFPDGTMIDQWFFEEQQNEIKGKKYYVEDYDIFPSSGLQTEKIQSLINHISDNGGGNIVFSSGTYHSGALFFRPGVNLCIKKGTMLLGSDDIADYPLLETRIEGETCQYFAALVNADKCDGFTIYGGGKIDGNGSKSWIAFWKRREENPQCTNKEVSRARLVYISNSNDININNVIMQNSQFWTFHLYRCNRAKITSVEFISPFEPVPAPSTDGIDIDVCENVKISKCKFSVNDDAIALKGGKGYDAHEKPVNGPNKNIWIDDCHFGLCHACLTCGSESLHDRNILLSNSTIDGPYSVLHLKMRTDTKQHYEYIKVSNFKGKCERFLEINAWSQFEKLNGEKPHSDVNDVYMEDCDIECRYCLANDNNPNYTLRDFVFRNLKINAKTDNFKQLSVDGCLFENVEVAQ